MLVAFALIATVETSAAEWRQRSPRMATANVFSTNGTWNIAVSFVPVMAFEENKNLLENHRLAVTIAEWGLLKELHAAPSQMLETSGLQKTAFTGDDPVAAWGIKAQHRLTTAVQTNGKFRFVPVAQGRGRR